VDFRAPPFFEAFELLFFEVLFLLAGLFWATFLPADFFGAAFLTAGLF